MVEESKKKTLYHIASDTKKRNLVGQVNYHLDRGWNLVGGISVTSTGMTSGGGISSLRVSEDFLYAQALKKKVEV